MVFNWESVLQDRHPGLTPEWADEVRIHEYLKSKSKDVSQINQDLRRTRKALIILGCSFADGQGAIPTYIIDQLTPTYHPIDNALDYTCEGYTDQEIGDLAVEHKLPVLLERRNQKSLTCSVYHTEIHNSWGAQVGRLLNDEYTVINCADRGAGNNSAISKLYRYPIEWDQCDEVLVVWSVCDYTRWSMLHSLNLERNLMTGDSRTFWWIHQKPGPTAPASQQLNWQFSQQMYSTALFFIDQYVDNCVQLKTWTKQFKKSNMVLIPAFSQLPELDPGMEWHYYLSEIASKSGKDLAKIIKNSILTEHVWDVDGHDDLAKLCLAMSTQEHNNNYADWFHFSKKNSEGAVGNTWITPCNHPTYIAQREIAQRLHKHLQSNVL